MSNSIGPSLPPHLKKAKNDEESDIGNKSDDTAVSIGPALPSWLQKKKEENKEVIGPCIPDRHKNIQKEREDQGTNKNQANDAPNDSTSIGPSLPPWLKDREELQEGGKKDDSSPVETFGPSLPPGFGPKPRTIGPALPSSTDQITQDKDDDFVIGPLPPTHDCSGVSTVAEEFEKRAKKMKDRLTGNEEPEKVEREEWMTELPPLLQGFGGGPRKFRARARETGDRSVWTETPADRERKANQKKEQEAIPDDERLNMEMWAKRDAEIASKLADYGKNDEKESLLKMHEKSRKRKQQEAEDAGEANLRRPFDRELDLQTNKFDDAAKKRFIKKTQGLSSRFSTGSTTAKFL